MLESWEDASGCVGIEGDQSSVGDHGVWSEAETC